MTTKNVICCRSVKTKVVTKDLHSWELWRLFLKTYLHGSLHALDHWHILAYSCHSVEKSQALVWCIDASSDAYRNTVRYLWIYSITVCGGLLCANVGPVWLPGDRTSTWWLQRDLWTSDTIPFLEQTTCSVVVGLIKCDMMRCADLCTMCVQNAFVCQFTLKIFKFKPE